MTKKAKLHSLFGVHPSFGKSDPDVIELLEKTLKQARKGEIAGISLAVVDGAGNLGARYASGFACKNLMMASVHLLHTEITRIWYSSTEDLGAEKK